MSQRRMRSFNTAVLVFLIADFCLLPIHSAREKSWPKKLAGPLASRANKEMNTEEFVRLVLMRLVYGLASTMGVEERLEGVFNGAFVPPNADSSIFSFGNFDEFLDDDADDYDIF